MPELIDMRYICDECGQHDQLFPFAHSLELRGERNLCIDCFEGQLEHFGHIEMDVLVGTLEEDPWPDGPGFPGRWQS